MTDSLSDDAHLRATEEQMRRALGLQNTSPTQAIPVSFAPTASASHPQRRRFGRDGEVPVSVIRRDQGDGANTNKLDATRQALREQIEARERAEHLLQEAQATIHDLQTKLAHERFARDEAIQRVDGDRQVVEQALLRVQEELAIERDQRQKVVQERDETAVALRPRSVQEVMVTQDARKASQVAPRHRPAPDVAVLVSEPTKTMPTTEPSAGGHEVKLTRRRGRPAKSDQSEAEIVEWWKPGWRNRIR